MAKSFTLKELGQDFWDKLIFFSIERSSSLGGAGCLWLITSDIKLYFIDFDSFPYEESELENFHPIFKRVREGDKYLYVQAEKVGFKRYIGKCPVWIYVKEKYFECYEEKYSNMWDKNIASIHYVDEVKVMAQVLGVKDMERYDYSDLVQ